MVPAPDFGIFDASLSVLRAIFCPGARFWFANEGMLFRGSRRPRNLNPPRSWEDEDALDDDDAVALPSIL